ncbi:MAG: HlyD family efflux transporter periplasmic adaptor subunit [Bacteroidota bacterium]
MRRSISIAFGILIIIGGISIFYLARSGRASGGLQAVPSNSYTKVKTQRVTLKSLPYWIEATGTLTAKRKVELYSEVQGTLLPTKTVFKAGSKFRKGELLLSINSAEHRAQLQSNKSSLVNQIAAMMPDMEVDFPKASAKWVDYLRKFNIEGPLVPLPKTTSDSEKLFVTGKNIVQTYYTVKNLQERLAKYYLSAPFTGTVTESNVDVGTLVRSGQKLGEFIDPTVYELELAIAAADSKYLKDEQPIALSSLNGEDFYSGKVSRINPRIDRETQTITVIVEVADQRLREGQYLKAKIRGESLEDVFMVSSELLVENNHMYIIKDSTLHLQRVIPVNYLADSIVVRDLDNGMLIAQEIIPNAHPGMKVSYK